MEITRTARWPSSNNGVKLWHCDRCGKVHLSAGEAITSLDRDEFAGFVQTAVEIYYRSWEAIAADGAAAGLTGLMTESVH